ncbi:MAG: hypothetical protein MPI95_05475 [Nitrosopumilus sp.]|nr:hypothetical protein [Nitrosopumilus sp.]CAI9831465.1 hypothetical protein IBTHAUMO2_250009 [Nitrosopumilaceae archaeon]MDA7945472.1 hypothetical protein [Nitrosopumilus sp.]MDA7953487.1 hypothetical protein [Nitrosopumilus sp.]MDA7955232.1 hypothetical protein [Nitrosopumilus sp.]
MQDPKSEIRGRRIPGRWRGLPAAPALYLSWRKRDRAVAARYLRLGLGIWFATGIFGWTWIIVFAFWHAALRS